MQAKLKIFFWQLLNYDDDFSILCRFRPPSDELSAIFISRHQRQKKLHNLLLLCFAFLRTFLQFFTATNAKMFLIENDKLQRVSLPKKAQANSISFPQIHPGPAQVHPSRQNRHQNFPVPTSQLHLHRSQLHGHEKSFAYTQWRAIVYLHTAELRLSWTNNGTIAKVKSHEMKPQADDAVAISRDCLQTSRNFSIEAFFCLSAMSVFIRFNRIWLIRRLQCVSKSKLLKLPTSSCRASRSWFAFNTSCRSESDVVTEEKVEKLWFEVNKKWLLWEKLDFACNLFLILVTTFLCFESFVLPFLSTCSCPFVIALAF